MRNKLLCIKSGMSSCTNAHLKLRKTDQPFLLAGFQVMLSGGEEDWNPNAAKWLKKYKINLDADILPANDTGKSSALALPHNL